MANPHRIGKYLAEKALGAGSFATVWLAFDELLEVQVAIKVLADNWARNADIRRRFIEEARLLRRIDHDRVVRVFDVDELSDGRPYFVMAVADRGTLHEKIEDLPKGQPMDTEIALRLGLEICEALSIVHDFGVVHRDIKPSNILFRSIRNHERVSAQRAGRVVGDDAAMIGDFGLAKDLAVASGFTLAAGTPAYMAPEQAHATSVIDRRVDVFATTAVIYEMLAGHPAFASETLSGVRRSRAESLAQPLFEVRPDLPIELSDVLAKGMARLPDDRFDSCFALADALVDFIPGVTPQIAEPIPLETSQRTTIETRPPPSMPPPAQAAPTMIMELTGAAGRVNDLVTGSRLLINDEPTALEVTSRLVRPFTTTVIGPITPETLLLTAGLRVRDDMTAHHALSVGGPLVGESDLVVMLISADEPEPLVAVNELMAALKAADVGPYAVEGLVVGTPGHGPQRVLEEVRGSPAGATLFADLAAAEPQNIARLQAHAVNLAEVRGVVFRATSGLRIIQLAMKVAPSAPGRTDLLDRIETLQQELPVLLELELLREIVSGRAALPRWLRTELARLLIHSSPAIRLGLPPDADAAELRAAVEATSTGWRTLENTGRIPFSARKAMLVAQQALDRLHAELAYYG
jgi:eukaryotic-like serine/threonine-protein kinase